MLRSSTACCRATTSSWSAVCAGARGRIGLGQSHAAEIGERLRVDGIGLGPAAQAPGKAAHLWFGLDDSALCLRAHRRRPKRPPSGLRQQLRVDQQRRAKDPASSELTAKAGLPNRSRRAGQLTRPAAPASFARLRAPRPASKTNIQESLTLNGRRRSDEMCEQLPAASAHLESAIAPQSHRRLADSALRYIPVAKPP